MGVVNSSYNDKLNRQETAINLYYNSYKCDLSCGSKYSKRQIKGNTITTQIIRVLMIMYYHMMQNTKIMIHTHVLQLIQIIDKL